MGEKLNQLYGQVLDYCSMQPQEDGEIHSVLTSVFDGDDTEPVMLEHRKLVMPIDVQFNNYDPDKVIIFHPLQEYLNRSESEVVKALRYHLNVRINYTTMAVASALLELLAKPAVHRELTPEQRELLLAVNDVDLTMPARFLEFSLKNYASSASRFYCNIYLKKAGTFRGEKHARVGIVQFPIYELLETSDKKLKKGDEETFTSLVEFMFPESKSDTEAYNGFSDSRDAPWLDCLLRTSFNLTQRLNELIELYKPYIDKADSLLFNDSWVDAMDNLDRYRDEIRRIPAQQGNEGGIEGKEPEQAPQRPSAKPQSTQAASQAVPARTAPERREIVTQLPAPAPQQQPMYQQAYPQAYPQLDQWGRPIQAMPGYPQQQQMPPPQPPGLAYTENGKLDFNSVGAVNPMVAMAGTVATPLTDWQQAQNQRGMPPMNRDPRFAGYPQQMPQVDAWGRPIQMPMMQGYPQQMPQVDAWGRPIDPRFANVGAPAPAFLQGNMIRPV